jgi:hypothetical protein
MNFLYVDKISLYQLQILEYLKKIKNIHGKGQCGKSYNKREKIRELNKLIDELILYIEKEDEKYKKEIFKNVNRKEHLYIEKKKIIIYTMV